MFLPRRVSALIVFSRHIRVFLRSPFQLRPLSVFTPSHRPRFSGSLVQEVDPVQATRATLAFRTRVNQFNCSQSFAPSFYFPIFPSLSSPFPSPAAAAPPADRTPFR